MVLRMKTSSDLRKQLERLKGQKESLENQLSVANSAWREHSILGRKLEEAQAIIKTVALQTQQELQFHISNITTSALEAVFPDPYEFQIEFSEKGDRTEAEAHFIKNKELIDPMTGSGGGAVDVAAFSLRCSVWRLKPSRPVVILDEPFRYLSRDLQPRAAEMLKEISQKLKLQIIMVTHNEDLLECADRVFTVKQRDGVSTVTSSADSQDKIKTRKRTA